MCSTQQDPRQTKILCNMGGLFISSCLTELAALNAHYDSVRKQAIELLDKNSLTTLQRIVDKDTGNEFSQLAEQRI